MSKLLSNQIEELMKKNTNKFNLNKLKKSSMEINLEKINNNTINNNTNYDLNLYLNQNANSLLSMRNNTKIKNIKGNYSINLKLKSEDKKNNMIKIISKK